MNKQQLTSIDLFSGCGGMTLGFGKAGFTSVLASDIDENCEKTFATNFPEIPFLCGDLSDFKKNDFDAHINNIEIDVIIGGPPCQGFSLANKRRNKASDDPRNRLFYEFIKTIDWYNPKSFVMENVKGLLSMQSGKVIKQILKEFESAGTFGYEVEYKTLRAFDYGVPQSRERVIVIGIRKDLGVLPEFPERIIEKEVTVDEAISDLPQIQAGEGTEKMKYASKPKSGYQKLMRENSKAVFNHIAMKHTKRVIQRFEAIKPGKNLLDVWETHGAVQRGNPSEKSKIKFSQNNLRLIPDKPAPTIAASFQSNFIHPYLHRNFTAREGARLQSFPDDFIFEGMRTKMSWEKGLSQYQQIGNAVPPLMAFEIAKTLKKLLKNEYTTEDSIHEISE
jgi:DNA (cytosine-5)-methyltransferase 1